MKLLIVTQKVDEDDQLLGFFIDWLRLLADKFESIIVLCLEEGNYNLPQNVRVVSLGKDKGKSKLSQLLSFYKYILTGDYNSVFVHMNPIWAVLGGVIWRAKGKKTYLWYTHKSVTLKLRLAEKFSDKIFTASPESFRLKSTKVIVTGHGIDTDLFSPNQEKPVADHGLIKILSVGRIAPIKNYGILVEAARVLRERGVGFVVSMIGEPALKEDKGYELRLKNKINELGLEGNFKFLGKVGHKNLPPHYQSNQIFVHLSQTGSLDKTMLEAMASGMIVLSSNDAAKGILPSELFFDSPQELANKIIGNQSTQDLRDYVVKNHDLKNLISKISNIIQS